MDSINIAGKNYPLKFGYGAFRTLGLYWKQKGIQGVIKVFEATFKDMGEDPDFDALEKISDLVNAGISNAGGDHINSDDVLDELVFNDSGKLQLVVNAFMRSIPGVENGKKKVSQKKRSKPVKKKT